MKQALILFVRQPELGKVKTRLAASIGDQAALAIYKKLLQHTHSITHQLPVDTYLFYTDTIAENDIWSNGKYKKLVQATGDLGQRMQQAFTYLFKAGYKEIVIIGSDCHELNSTIIIEAFDVIRNSDVVIGPAKDGGYYLLGMRDNLKKLFHSIEWSTESVFAQTLALIHQNQYSYSLLPILSDIDTVEDLPNSWKQELQLL